MRKKKKQSLLWRIDGDHLPGTSYLFGTMHVKNQKAFKKQDMVYAKMLTCQAFATEFDLDEISQARDPSIFLLPFGQTLDQLMSPKKYAKLRKIIRKVTNLDLDRFRHLQPLAISNLVDEVILATDMPLALDAHLWEFAKRSNLRTMGIETFAEQISILKKIPLDYQIEALVSMGKNISRHRRHLHRLAEMYENEDLAMLHKTARKGGRDLKRLLIDDRNRLMANRLAAYCQEQTLLFAVGAGHLAGEKGLLRLLKFRGLKVKPVF